MGIKYKINEKFFDNWNPEMAYILGYIYADGSLEDASYLRGKYVRITSVDLIIIEKIRQLLGSEHKIIKRESRIVKFKLENKSYKSKASYLLRIGSHALYESLVKLGLYPNKSLTIKFPAIPVNVFRHFVRGYFDGDGCVYLETAKGISKERIIKRLLVIFTSGSMDFLVSLQRGLTKSLGLGGKIYYQNRAGQLRYTTGDAVKFFHFMYSGSNHLHLERKFDIFVKYFSLRPARIDELVNSVLNQFGHVAN